MSTTDNDMSVDLEKTNLKKEVLELQQQWEPTFNLIITSLVAVLLAFLIWFIWQRGGIPLLHGVDHNSMSSVSKPVKEGFTVINPLGGKPLYNL